MQLYRRHFAAPKGELIEDSDASILQAALASAPTASATNFQPGATWQDLTNAVNYINTGTKTAATWKAFARDGGTTAVMTITTLTATTATVTTMAGTPNFSGAVTMATTLAVTGVITPTGGVAAAGGFTATPCGQINTSGYPAIVSTYGTDTAPTTTTVYVTEIFVPCNMTIVGVRFLNGSATANGNVTIGLYTSAGVAIAAALTAATATSGNDAYQAVPFAVAYAAVGPAKYLIGFQWSSATDRYNTHTAGFFQEFTISQASATIGVTAISPVPTGYVTAAAVVASLY